MILKRKLAAVELKYGEAGESEKQHYALLAPMCIYGIERLAGNIAECRANMLEVLADCLDTKAPEYRHHAASYAISQNVIHCELLLDSLEPRPVGDDQRNIVSNGAKDRFEGLAEFGFCVPGIAASRHRKRPARS